MVSPSSTLRSCGEELPSLLPALVLALLASLLRRLPNSLAPRVGDVALHLPPWFHKIQILFLLIMKLKFK